MSNKSAIITLPHESLRQRSKKVGLITDEVRDLANSMIASTLDWENNRKHEVGVALAAVQINKLLRVVIIREDFENRSNKNFQVFINPTITKKEGELVEDFEGCLSIKDVYGKVPRHSKIKIKAIDLSGGEIRLTAEGFLARVIQHEIDHTNGKLFVDHIATNPDAFYHLNEEGQLEKLNYEKDIKNNSILW